MQNNTLFFYCINVTGAHASVLSVRLCLVPFWTTQPSYRELHFFFRSVVLIFLEGVSRSPENCLADPSLRTTALEGFNSSLTHSDSNL